jgi:hypothetical protein
MTRKRFASARRTWHVALAAAALLGLGLAGCDDSGVLDTVSENELAPPLGLRSITGNGQVTLFWYTSNFEDGFEGYIVFQREGGTATNQSSTLPTGFIEVGRLNISGSSNAIRNTVIQDLSNGTQYTFAVCAFRSEGDEISLASNIVEDTPRPDITSITLTSASTNDVPGNDQTAGFDFDLLQVVPVPTDLAASNYNSANGADMVHEAFDPSQLNNNIRSWMAGMNGDTDSGVQDLGFMEELDGADVAPEDGYPGNGNSVLLSAGHVYAVKTGNGHFGKFIVTSINETARIVTFNAAFQTRPGDPNYFPVLGIH